LVDHLHLQGINIEMVYQIIPRLPAGSDNPPGGMAGIPHLFKIDLPVHSFVQSRKIHEDQVVDGYNRGHFGAVYPRRKLIA